MSKFGLRLEDECFPTEQSQAIINHGEKNASPWKCIGLGGPALPEDSLTVLLMT